MGRPSTSKPRLGKYQDEPGRGDGASMSSAMSLHSDICFEDGDDIPELPPYSDDPEDVAQVDSSAYDQAPLMQDMIIRQYENKDSKGTSMIRLSPVLTTDPIALKKYVLEQAKHELKAQIAIMGTHQETHRTSDKKTEKKTVTDFSFYVDVTDTISRRRHGDACWSWLEIVSNDCKTYRASIFKRRDKRFREDVESMHETASLDEWCHLFCASTSKLKTFTLRRTITDRDDKLLHDNLSQLIRGTHYRGTVSVTFPTAIRSVSITTPHWINKLRTNIYIWWACVILQLWVLTWPALVLMTRRWDVLRVRFPFKRGVVVVDDRNHYNNTSNSSAGAGQGERETTVFEYVSESETEWCKKWAYTIQQACVCKIGGDEGNFSSAVNRGIPQVAFVDEQEERTKKTRRAQDVEADLLPQGSGGVLGLVRGGLAAVGEWRRNQDWGFDS